jgi:DNA-binding MarR family transcriptional regulator
MHQKYIAEVRAFNRFYTDIIGLVDRYILNSSYTLPEVRILYELYHHENITASDIISFLTIDKGYLSRILFQFEKKKLISKKRSAEDGRSVYIFLTAKGKKEFAVLNQASHNQIRDLLGMLSPRDCDSLVEHMSAITKILRGSIKNKEGPLKIKKSGKQPE